MQRRSLVSMLFVVVLTLGLLAYTFLAGNKPFLGLDLQGGVAVILAPSGDATDEQLDDAVSIIRSRVDSIGVAEPEITRQGQNISVEIPGVSDRQQAIDLVGQTGELTFRPVLEEFQTGFAVDANGQPVLPQQQEGVDADDPATSDDGTRVPGAPSPGGGSNGDDEGSLGLHRRVLFGNGESATGMQDPEPAPDGSLDIDSLPEELRQQLLNPQQTTGNAASGLASQLGLPELTGDTGLDQIVVEAQYRVIDGVRYEVARYRLGPASLTGAGLEGASASIDERGQWVVRPTFKAGAAGIDAFNTTASACFARSAQCPTGLFAITLDAEVISALGVQAASFSRDEIVISGGFTERTSKDLGTVLRYGALPVQLEIQSVQEVSATLGRDALRAGVIAGIIGLLLVAAYMLYSYRLLGLTAVIKLALELGLLWAIIAWLGTSQGLALTLAGVTGIVVSFGLSVDSNVVLFETVKEDLRRGRSVRSAAERSFASAWRTIVKADTASLIVAALLYALAVGPVRGFAFYLGLATLLDLFVAWFFMRPSSALSLRSGVCARHPRWFALPTVATPDNPGGTPRQSDAKQPPVPASSEVK
jgi:preprotein translocase subunit SecD